MKVALTVPAARRRARRATDMVWSYPKFAVFRDAQQLFSDLALYTDDQITIAGDGERRARSRARSSDARYLPTLGVRPRSAATFSPTRIGTPTARAS